MAHLVERRGNEAGQPDDIRLFRNRGLQDLLRRHHHAEIDDRVVVALQDDADDVLADVVDVALDRGEHDLAGGGRMSAPVLVLFHVGQEIGDRLLHHPRRLHHLRQEHAARAEQIADHVHAVHQRAFDHGERPRRLAPRFVDIDLDEVGDAVHQRVRQPLLHRPFAPGQIGLFLLLAVAAMAFGERQQPLAGIGAAVEHDVLARLAQFGIEIVVDRDLPGIDDAHIHAGGDGVIEKHRMHRLAQELIAAEREGKIGDAAGDVGMRQVLPDPARGFDEGDAVAAVLLHAGRHSKDVRIEDDVLRRKADAVDQDVVGARGDLGLALEGVGLARFVERHDHDGGAVTAHQPGVMDEGVLALLERDRIHHRLALHAFETGLDHRELRGIDHQRHAGDVRLRRDEIEERGHRLLGIEQALVHVDVEDLRAVLDLVAGDGQRGRVIAGGDELAEARRAGDVGAFADIHERESPASA